MQPLEAGDRVFVRYEGFATHHERTILGRMRGSLYFILSPEADVYIEDYNMTNEDIETVWVMISGQVPVDFLEGEVHRFDVPGVADRIREFLAKARLQAHPRSAVPAPGGLDRERGGGVTTVGPDGEAGKWRVGESGVPSRLVGEIVPGELTPARAVDRLPCKEIIEWEDEPVFIEFVPDDEFENWKSRKAPLDSRILRVETTGSKRHRDWGAQTIESAHAERVRDHVPPQGSGGGARSSGSLTYEEQEAFTGTMRSSCVMSDVAKSSELMQSNVKAREIREQVGKHKE